MICIRVRAKSGLHAGATWTLSNNVIALGSNTHADVFLCDPEIPSSLISLKKVGRKYLIDYLHDEVRSSSQDRVILPSQVLSINYRQVQLELDVLNVSSNFIASIGDSANRYFYAFVKFLRGFGLKAFASLIFLLTFLLTVMIVFYGTTGGEKVEASVLKHSKQSSTPQGNEKSVSDSSNPMARAVAGELDHVARELKIRDLNIQVNKSGVNLNAALSRVQTAGLEKALSRLATDYGQTVQIKAKVQLTAQQRVVDSIQVEQVVLGQRPVAVLQDGSRLFLGAQYHGVKLIAIDANKLVFSGDTTYEVML